MLYRYEFIPLSTCSSVFVYTLPVCCTSTSSSRCPLVALYSFTRCRYVVPVRVIPVQFIPVPTCSSVFVYIMPVRNVALVRVHPGVHLKFCIRGVHSGSCTGTKRSYQYEIWPYSVPVSCKGDTRFRSGTIWVTELIGTGSESLSIGNTSLKWLAETKAHMKRRVIPVKWLPCKRRTKLDFVPVSCKQPLTCLNFKFSGTCDRIVLYLKLRWYCRDGSLTRPLKKIGPGSDWFGFRINLDAFLAIE